MKAVGIIAEYNPFHNGHAYQLTQAKKLAKADYAIVALSGNFTQRGAPAILDKFSRTAMALHNGADFVFELPTLWAVSSAEYFAAAGVTLFHLLGCIDTLCFGCETPDFPLIGLTARLLAEEPDAYQDSVSRFLKQGVSFPAAREQSLLSILKQQSPNTKESDLRALLQSPNNILALEYQKALIRLHSPICPLPILRDGSGYHDTKLNKTHCSASALRRHLLQPRRPLAEIAAYAPPETIRQLNAAEGYFLSEQDFSQILFYKLLSERAEGFSGYADNSEDLSNKIIKRIRNFTDFTAFCKELKSKDVTYTRISRALTHILLNHRKKDYESARNCGTVPYLRLLGYRKDAADFFPEIKKNAAVPIVARPAKDAAALSKDAAALFQHDVFASDLYYGVFAQKSNTPPKNELQQKLLNV